MRSFRPAPPDPPHLVESGSRGLRDVFRRDPPQLHGLLRRARACCRALGVARALGARPVRAAHDRRYAAVQAVLPGRGETARASSDVHPALLPRGRHRRGRLDGPSPHVLPDDGQLLVRRLLQAGRGGDGLRALDGRMGARPRAHLGDRLRGRRPARARRRRAGSLARAGHPRRAASSRSARTTSGRRGRQGHAARARSSTTTAASSSAAAGPSARRGATAIASSSSGISSSWSSIAETTGP